MNEAIFVESKTTGGHYAFQTKNGKKPFENNMRECKSIKLKKNDIVADIGAYVGEYSMYAIRNGAKKVYSYEATPNTFKVLSKNKLEGMRIFNRAVVGSTNKFVRLNISKGIGVTNSIVKTKAESIKVRAIQYEKALKKASVVKIDVEGAEYSYNIIQPQLRAIILEFHPIAKEPWREWAEKIMKDLKKAGFKPIIKPTFESGWNLTGSWIRERKLK